VGHFNREDCVQLKQMFGPAAHHKNACLYKSASSPAVMAGMVVLSLALGFIQEGRADSAAAKLKAMVLLDGDLSIANGLYVVVVARPRPWNIDEIKRLILFIGPISSIFDYTTFFVMLWVFHGWDPRAGISDGLVRRVADDADAHCPRHSHQ